MGNSTYTIGKVNITKSETSILDKGLGFIPNIETIDIESEKKEIEKKVDRVIIRTIKEYTGERPTQRKRPYTLSKEIAEKAEREYKDTEERNKGNLTRIEAQALNKLKRRKDIVIKPIDKNLGTAVIERELYIAEIEKALKDPKNYKELKEDPTEKTIKTIRSLIVQLYKDKKINKRIMEKILPNSDAKAGRFYGLPKIHKPKLGWRPIISNNGHPTENLSKWINTILNPTARKSLTYIENGYELCQEIEEINQETEGERGKEEEKKEWIIITADVENLYTNIPHREGTETCIETLYNDNENKLKPKDKKAMQALIYNTITNNVFEFNNKYFAQIHGTAMGTSMAPTYANIYLANKEEKWLKKTKEKGNMVLFKRYLDDIIIIYNNHGNTLPNLLKEMEETYAPLKLTIDQGKKQTFLDLEIEIGRKRIEYSMYRKPLNSKEIIPYNSAHPKECKIGTIIGEYKRIDRLNSNTLNSRKEEIKLLNKSLKQGYPYNEIKHAKWKAKRRKKKEERNKEVHLTLTYNEQAKIISRKVKEELEIARKKQEEKEGKEIPKVNLRVAYKTQNNIKKILTRARVPKLNAN